MAVCVFGMHVGIVVVYAGARMQMRMRTMRHKPGTQNPKNHRRRNYGTVYRQYNYSHIFTSLKKRPKRGVTATKKGTVVVIIHLFLNLGANGAGCLTTFPGPRGTHQDSKSGNHCRDQQKPQCP